MGKEKTLDKHSVIEDRRCILGQRLTVVLEDSDGGTRESSSQHQRGMVQLIAQDQTTLQDTRTALIWINDPYIGGIFVPKRLFNIHSCTGWGVGGISFHWCNNLG